MLLCGQTVLSLRLLSKKQRVLTGGGAGKVDHLVRWKKMSLSGVFADGSDIYRGHGCEDLVGAGDEEVEVPKMVKESFPAKKPVFLMNKY